MLQNSRIEVVEWKNFGWYSLPLVSDTVLRAQRPSSHICISIWTGLFLLWLACWEARMLWEHSLRLRLPLLKYAVKTH